MIYLDFPNFDEPVFDILGRSYQHAVTMILSLTQNSIQILNTSHDANGHFTTLSWSFWARIQRRTESFTNFLDTGFKLVSLEEDDEDGFVHLISLSIIDTKMFKLS
jgi:hypothetical protein